MGTGDGREGLALQQKGTLSQGERLKRSADDLDAVGGELGGGGTWWDTVPDLSLFGTSTYGEYGAEPAFRSFARAWHEEITTLAGALREIRGRIGDGVSTTTGTDHRHGRDMSAIRVPGEDGR